VAVLAAVAALFSVIPSGSEALSPYRPLSTQRIVNVNGKLLDDVQCCVYLVGVSERKVSMLQKWLLQFDETVSFVPAPHDDAQEKAVQRFDKDQIVQSKQIAAAVAYELLGKPVKIEGGGAFIEKVDSAGPAGKSLQPGDTVVKINGLTVHTAKDLSDFMSAAAPGTMVKLGFRRDRLPMVANLKSAAKGAGQHGSRLGVEVSTPKLKITLPEKVTFSSGDIVGPSAGLAFALTLYDAENHGLNLTRGRNIVATGALSLDGDVAEVGGVRQKAIAAQRFVSDHGRVQLMLVPKGNLEEAQNAVKEFCEAGRPCVKVVGVSSVAQAVQVLRLDNTAVGSSAADLT
jgi:PDZ domain-containing protein